MKSTAVDCVTREATLLLCERVNTSASLKLAICLRYSEDMEIASSSIRALDYLNADSFSKDYLIHSFLRKWVGLETGVDKERSALLGWEAAEAKCAETNRRFRDVANRVESRLGSVLYGAQQKIASVLGRLSSTKCFEDCRWGPGATFDILKRDGLDQKVSRTISVTWDCIPYGRAMLASDPLWFESLTGFNVVGPYSPLDSCFEVVRGNRFLTVPKTALIDRCIAAEPTMNGFLQSGVGRYLRKRLSRFGVRLEDQSVNQRMAARAVYDSLATLDLSAASDSIARELVFHLLPLDWALFLDRLRSKESRVNDVWRPLSKFSSMGNGFTFELETLIFWALTMSVVDIEKGDPENVSVYGDDIICHQKHSPLVIDTLESCGFSINYSKSYTQGVFFESCGHHYFDGHFVTPVFQKSLVNSGSEVIRLHNRLYRWSLHMRMEKAVSKVLRKLRDDFLKTVNFDKTKFPALPLGTVGDDGFLMPHSFFKVYDISHGFYCRVLSYEERDIRALDLPLYAYKVRKPFISYSYRKSKESEARFITKPSGTGRYRYRTRYINYHDLVEFGPYEPERSLYSAQRKGVTLSS